MVFLSGGQTAVHASGACIRFCGSLLSPIIVQELVLAFGGQPSLAALRRLVTQQPGSAVMRAVIKNDQTRLVHIKLWKPPSISAGLNSAPTPNACTTGRESIQCDPLLSGKLIEDGVVVVVVVCRHSGATNAPEWKAVCVRYQTRFSMSRFSHCAFDANNKTGFVGPGQV